MLGSEPEPKGISRNLGEPELQGQHGSNLTRIIQNLGASWHIRINALWYNINLNSFAAQYKDNGAFYTTKKNQ
jgi:hypothetical protein